MKLDWIPRHCSFTKKKKKDVELQQIVNADMWSYHAADIGPVKWSLGHIATVEIAESRPCQLPFAVMGKSLYNSSPGLELQCANMKKKASVNNTPTVAFPVVAVEMSTFLLLQHQRNPNQDKEKSKKKKKKTPTNSDEEVNLKSRKGL